MNLNKVCIVSSKRIPFARSGSSYLGKSNLDLVAQCLKALVRDLSLEGKGVGEVALGAVNKHSYDFGLAREAVIESGLNLSTPATDLQKACGTSLETTIMLANKIALGQIDCGIAAGVDTNSDIPVELKKSLTDRLSKINYSKTMGEKIQALAGIRPSDLKLRFPAVKEPRTGLSMGQSCELMAKTWNISREEQDLLSYESHLKAANAYEKGFYHDMIVPAFGLEKDNILRPDTTVEKLAKLRSAFDKSDKGTLTAGNSTSLTDGASCVFLCSENYAKENGLTPLAYFRTGHSSAVNFMGDEGLLMAPAYAVAQMLKREGLTFEDFDFFEIHEAFAAQVLCTLKAWEDEKFCKEKLGLETKLGSINRDKMNTKGGSLALGHPFAATGSRIVGSLAKILNEKGSGRGLISICTAGGMGVCAIVEK
tara:strand:+ start:127956 stop:129227 length:1272 start_codon:yes stop_codon:yes gene_type:complete